MRLVLSELVEQLVIVVKLVKLVSRAFRAPLVLTGQQVRKACRESVVSLVRPVHKVLRENRVCLVC